MFNKKKLLIALTIFSVAAVVMLCLVLLLVSPGLSYKPPKPTLLPTALIPSGFVEITNFRAAIRSGPGEKFPSIKYVRDGFRVLNVREGDRLQVIAKWHFWYNVILPDGQRGWLNDEDAVLIQGSEIPVVITVPASPTRPPAEPLIILTSTSRPFQNFSSGCCKICTTGKACGDSCINSNYTCNQPSGCACN